MSQPDRPQVTSPIPQASLSQDEDKIPIGANIRAHIYSWLILAGFLVFPGTFSSLSTFTTLSNSANGELVQNAVKNIPLLPLAFLCCLVGTVKLAYIWRDQRTNYVWLISYIFL
jgi:hypothetical protein